MPPSKPLPTSMLAWQHHPSVFSSSSLTSGMRLNQTAAVPKLKPSQTLVKVLTAGLNPVDYKLGELPFIGRMAFGSTATPAVDYVGRVWSTTLSEPAHIKAGDLVYGKLEPGANGTLSGFTVVSGSEGVVKAPDGVKEIDELAGVGVAGLTAYQSIVPFLEDNGEGSAQGKSVFINGSSGGVGTFGVQMAKAIGCENIVVSCSAANAELVKGLGATEVIDYRSVNVPDALSAWVKNKNSGKPLDHIVDNAGADMNIYWRAHEYLKEGKAYAFVGAGVSLKATMDLTKVMMIPAFLGGGQRKFQLLFAKTNKAHYERIGKMMGEGKVKCIIDRIYAMEEAPEAYARLKTGRARGKVLVKVSEEGRGPGS